MDWEEKALLEEIYIARTRSARDFEEGERLDHLAYEGLLKYFRVPRPGKTPLIVYRLTERGRSAIGKEIAKPAE